MKPKHHILLSSIIALALAPAVFAQEKSGATATATASGTSGTAVITVDANGKKETKVINLGDGKNGVTTSASVHVGSFAKTAPTTWLGISSDEVSEELAAQLPLDPGTGLIVDHVIPDSPAAKAGLQKNDVLMKINDQILVNPRQLRTLVANRKAGEEVTITYLRKGEKKTASVALATNDGSPRDDATNEVSINLGGTKFDLDRVMKDAANAASSIIVGKKTVFVGPDGKPTPIDNEALADQVMKSLKDSGANADVMETVKKALEDVRNRLEETSERLEKKPLTR